MTARFQARWLAIGDRAGTVVPDGVVDVADSGRIEYVGPLAEAPPTNAATTALGGALLPGFVNTHCHAPMTLFRGAGEGLPLERWLHEVMWPREARLTPDDVYAGMALAATEMLRCGVTTSSEMYFHPEAMIAATGAAGARLIAAAPLLAPPGEQQLSTLDKQLAAALDHAASYDKDPRVQIALGPHSAYVVPVPFLTTVAERAKESGLLVHIHVAETKAEDAGLLETYGASTPRVLADNGVLEARLIAAHAVWMSTEDIEIFQRHDVSVAHCPSSNAKLASGIAPLTDLLAAGVRVGLGTDGPASNNTLDLWHEIRLASQLAKLSTMDTTALPAAEAFWLATGGGAAALGRDDIGVLEAGRWADLVHLDTQDSAFVPIETPTDLLTHLVWSAGSRHVRDTWVAGRSVVTDGVCHTLDAPTLRTEVQRIALRLAGV
jgi:5-methylthioadenosine/S-adenosylhomocysteine deaminase